jgi:ribonuclease-3
LAEATIDPVVDDPESLAIRLGHRFGDPRLLATALRHRSWCVEHPGEDSNERLEFLGDAVLGAIVAAELYRRHPELAEGRLTDARKAVVSTAALAPAGASLGLGDELLLGRGEDNTGGRGKPSLLENAFEAVVGAVFLDAGYQAAHEFVVRHLADDIEQAAHTQSSDFKSRLQEHVAQQRRTAPRYEVSSEGPDHARVFHATVWLDDDPRGAGDGRSKKQAEQAAAREALEGLLAAPDPHESETGHA